MTAIIHFADGLTAQIGDGTTIGGFVDTGINGTDGDLKAAFSAARSPCVTDGRAGPDPAAGQPQPGHPEIQGG